MKLIIFLSLLFFINSVDAQTKNILGYSLGGYKNFTPKYDLPGNNYHPFVEKNSTSAHGFTFERIINEKNSLQTGIYLNKQFEALMSLHFPVNYNYCLFQTSYKKFQAGPTLGVYLNVPIATSNTLFEMLEARYTYSNINLDVEVDIKKSFYIAPHAGLWVSFRFAERLGVRFQTLFHCPIPEYVEFTTSYTTSDGNIIEKNTNKNFGVSVFLSAQLWIGKLIY